VADLNSDPKLPTKQLLRMTKATTATSIAAAATITAVIFPALAPALYLAGAGSYIAAAWIRLPQLDRKVRRPWIALLIGIGSLFASVLARGIHGAIASQEAPFPSPADAGGYVGYIGIISCVWLFIRAHGHRHPRWRREAAIDGVIVAVAVAIVIFASILSPYILDDTIDLGGRLANVGYSVLTIVLVGHVATLAVGSGVRNRSWRLLAIGSGLIIISDILLLLHTTGNPWAARPAGGTAVAAFICGTAAIMHPDAARMSVTASAKPPSFSAGRLLMIGIAILIIPLSLSISLITGRDSSLLIIMVGALVLGALTLYRIWLLFAANERVAQHETSLRLSNTALASARHPNEAVDVAISTANEILGDSGFACSQDEPTTCELIIGKAPQEIAIVATAPLDDAQTIALQGLDAQLLSAITGIQMRESQMRHRLAHQVTALVEQSADLVTVVVAGKITFISPNAQRIVGRNSTQLVETMYLNLVHADDRDAVARVLDNATPGISRSVAMEARISIATDDYRWFDISARDFTDDPEVGGIVVTARDVTEERTAKIGLKRSEQWFRGLVQHSSDVIAVLDEAGVFTYASPAAEDLFGFRPEHLRGRSFSELLPQDDLDGLDSLRRATRHSHPRGERNLELALERPDKTRRTAEVTITDLSNDPSVNGLVLNIRDITDRKKLEDDLRHQVLHDDLTGLGNRLQFSNQLARALGPARHAGSMVAALFIDIDDFKNINDSLGHAAGDQVLVEISSRLQNKLRLRDRAARFGGDEFAVVLNDVYGESDIVRVADRIIEELSQPVTLHGQEVRMSVSVGIAIDKDGVVSAEDLIRSADVAMYEAKQQGKDRWEMFESSMADQTIERFEISNTLGAAIENEELMVYYQPIVDLNTGRTAGVEALVRWNHPNRGMISPESFIPIAEKNGLIVPLGKYVLDKAARQVAMWRKEGHDIYASVNVSPIQLHRDGIVTEILDIVDNAGLDRHAVVLELTESALINDFDLIVSRIDALRHAGLRVAIDDFGTGYATLKYAEEFAADILKIDQTFVARLEDHEESAIVATVLSIAESMGAQTVAEGIEVPDQHRRLLTMGCRLGQGYYFTRPAPAQAIAEALLHELDGESLIGHGH
jgi:diguanylate cyclase (GGDEF)-like protein/PAS domain S-box-containing protein